MSINPDVKFNPDGSVPVEFNLSNFISSANGYVTLKMLQGYANLKNNNIFSGILNTFTSIAFTQTINTIPASVFAFLSNVTSDIQTQFDDIYKFYNPIITTINDDITYLQNSKRDLSNNIFTGDLKFNSLSLQPDFNIFLNQSDTNSFSYSGYNNINFDCNLQASNLIAKNGVSLGNNSLSIINRNLNIWNTLRVGYGTNDNLDVGSSTSNNSYIDCNGGVYCSNLYLKNTGDFKAYVDNKFANYSGNTTQLNTTNLNSQYMIGNRLIINEIICNKMTTNTLIQPIQQNQEIIYGYLIIDGITYPIDKTIIYLNEFKTTFTSSSIIKLHLARNLIFNSYDLNGRIVDNIINSNPFYSYNNNISSPLNLSYFYIKNI